jgi:osmoprotectant transport system permease protein
MHIEVEHLLYDEFGILSLGGLGFENAYGLAMRRGHANALGIRSIQDLAAHASTLNFAGDLEFFSRAEWRNVVKTYGLDVGSQRSMDSTFMYQAVRDGEVDVISAYTTDGRIDAYDLIVLDDPLPGLVRTLSPLINSISQSAMRNANRQVDLNGLSPAAAARLLSQSTRR